jgi:hypothetical protein
LEALRPLAISTLLLAACANTPPSPAPAETPPTVLEQAPPDDAATRAFHDALGACLQGSGNAVVGGGRDALVAYTFFVVGFCPALALATSAFVAQRNAYRLSRPAEPGR